MKRPQREDFADTWEYVTALQKYIEALNKKTDRLCKITVCISLAAMYLVIFSGR